MPSARKHPLAKKASKRKPASAPRSAARTKKARATGRRRMLNGIPLKRKVIWVYDTESPEFQAIWAKERAALRNGGSDPELDRFVEDAAREIDRSLDR